MSRRTPAGPTGLPADYPKFVEDLKARIRQAQVRAALSANQELVLLYWDIGRRIAERQKDEGWGAAVIPRLAQDLRDELPEVKGFSDRNLKRMVAFFREYSGLTSKVPLPVAQLASAGKVPQPAAQLESPAILPLPAAKLTSGEPPASLQQLAARLPWAHNVLLIEKVKDLPTRLWYMQQTLAQGWSRDVLGLMIRNRAHEQQGKAVTNFAERLSPPQSDLAQQQLEDPSGATVFLPSSFRRKPESRPRGFWTPAFAGVTAMQNHTSNLVDDRLRHATDSPTIGLILCQDMKRLVAEYALKGVHKAIGVSEYELTRALPKEFRSSLPSIEEIERELSAVARPPSRKTMRKAGAKE